MIDYSKHGPQSSGRAAILSAGRELTAKFYDKSSQDRALNPIYHSMYDYFYYLFGFGNRPTSSSPAREVRHVKSFSTRIVK